MTETALPTTSFAENAVMTASRVSAVSWCFAPNIYRKGEQGKMIENEMTVVSVYSIRQGYAVAGRSRRWKKQTNAFHCRPALKGRTSALYRNGRKRAYDYHLSENGR